MGREWVKERKLIHLLYTYNDYFNKGDEEVAKD